MEGTPFGRYRLIELLGRGGMGEVWRAHDTDTDRIVAIKVLPAHLSDDVTFQQRFRREAHAAARLNSPHVIPIHDYGDIDGRLYVNMRLIEGRDLQTVLADGPIDVARAVRIIEQVATALHAAHEVGLVHRDVKPSNILLDKDDFAYLIDFGIARAIEETRLTSTGNAIGTFHYMAPERLGDHPSDDARADIYALACVLYECLTGQPPFAGASMGSLVAAHLNTPPPRPSTRQPNVPAQFDKVIATGMAKDPDQRYATTVELASAAHDAITTPIPRPAQNLRTPPPSVANPAPPTPATEPAAQQQPADLNLAATQQRPPGWPPVPPRRPADWPPPQIGAPPRSRWWRRKAIVIPAALLTVAVIAAGVWAEKLVSAGSSSPVLSAPESSTSKAPATAEPSTALGSPLPPFKPPAGLGANCQYQPTPNEPAAKKANPPIAGKVPTDPAHVSMTITTNEGPIGVQLDNAQAPCTVNNFASLAQQGYFNDTYCHRLTTGPSLFVLQCGDPKGDGTGGPGYQFADEYPTNQYPPGDPALSQPVVYPRGTLAMANAGPGTNGSQFFIVYKDSQLPPDYTVFGQVDAKDMGVLDKIAAAGTADGSPDGKPKTDVVITSARLD